MSESVMKSEKKRDIPGPGQYKLKEQFKGPAATKQEAGSDKRCAFIDEASY